MGSSKSSKESDSNKSPTSSSEIKKTSSKSSKDQGEGSKASPTTSSHNRQHSKSSRLSPHSRSSSWAQSDYLAGGKDGSQRSGRADAANDGGDDDDYIDDDDDETIRPVQKRLSSSTSSQKNMNVYTECGRHSEGWLVKPLVEGLKSLVVKKGHKEDK